MRIANQSALLMQKNDLYFHLIAIIFTSVLSGLCLRGKGWQHCQTSMKLEHSSQLTEHCKDKLPAPAWLCFLSYCTQHLSHILTLCSFFLTHQKGQICLLSQWDFFFLSLKLKTGINCDVASLHCHKTTVNVTYHCISVQMEQGGWKVKTQRQRERVTFFLSYLQWNLQRPVQLNALQKPWLLVFFLFFFLDLCGHI